MVRSSSFIVIEFILPGVALFWLIDVPQLAGSLLSSSAEILSSDLPPELPPQSGEECN